VTANLSVTPSAATVQEGKQVVFRIAAWASSGKEKGTITATVKIQSGTPAIASPTFTVGCASKTGCTVSPLPTKKPAIPQAEAELTIPTHVPNGDQVTVAFKMTASPEPSPSPSASSSKSTAGKSTAGTSAGSTGTTSGTSGTTYSLPVGSLPLVGATGVPGISATLPAGNASNLFPQINPSTAPSPAPGTQADPGRGAQPVADSSTIPLSLGSSEFGAQILGLIMLLLGVAIAVTRISLRKTRITGRGGTGN
jgi:hypothetical protein